MFKFMLLAASAMAVLSTTAFAQQDQYVSPYMRRDGTFVEGYHRTAPDSNPYNNYSTKGNSNPWTGQAGTVAPQPQAVSPYNGPTFGPNPYDSSYGRQPSGRYGSSYGR